MNGNRKFVSLVVSSVLVMFATVFMLTAGAQLAIAQACPAQNWAGATPNIWAATVSDTVMLNNDPTTNQPTIPIMLYDGTYSPWGYTQHPQAITQLNTNWSCPSGTPVISIAGAGRETVAFQIFITAPPTSSLSDVSVAITSLTGPGTLTSDNSGTSNVTRYLEGYVPYSCTGATAIGCVQATGSIPDPLIPFYDPYDSGNPAVATPFNVQPATTQGVWVDISIPVNQAAGTYNGTVTVSGNGIGTQTIPLQVTVWNGNLPGFDAGSVNSTYADMLKVWLPLYESSLDAGEGVSGTDVPLFQKYQVMAHNYDIDTQFDPIAPTINGAYPSTSPTSFTTNGTTSSIDWTAYDALFGPSLTPGGLFADGTAMRVLDSPIANGGAGAWTYPTGYSWCMYNCADAPLMPAGLVSLTQNYATQISQHFSANHTSKSWAIPDLLTYTFDENYNVHSYQLGDQPLVYQIISQVDQAINASNSSLSPTWAASTAPIRELMTDEPACMEDGDTTYYTASACADHLNLSYPGGAQATPGYTTSWVTAWSPNPGIYMTGEPGPGLSYGVDPTIIAGTGYQYTLDLTQGVPAESTAPVPIERWTYNNGGGGSGGVGRRATYWTAYKYGQDETIPSVGDPSPATPAPGGLWSWIGNFWGGYNGTANASSCNSLSPYTQNGQDQGDSYIFPGNELGCYYTANPVGETALTASPAVNTNCTSNDYSVCNGISGPVATRELEQWRRGYEDYEYLYLYGKQAGRAAAEAVVASVAAEGMADWEGYDWENIDGGWYEYGVTPVGTAYSGNCTDPNPINSPIFGDLPNGLPNGPTGQGSSGPNLNYDACEPLYSPDPAAYEAARIHLAQALGFAPATTPSITGLSPSSGLNTGGTSVGITGTNFSGATAVEFGGVEAASFAVNSATSITAISPAGNGTVTVQVFGPGGTSQPSSSDLYTYVSPVTVTGLSPSSGLAVGGNSVNITGTDFAAGAVVMFGTQAATNVIVNSSTSITATAASGSGTVNVTVTTSQGTSAENSADLYTYEAPPTVTGLSPNNGPIPGGTSVNISGTGFASGMTVMFGGNAASNVVVGSATSLTATSPAGSSSSGGVVDVTVTTTDGTSTINGNDQYNYTSPVTITGVSPASGAPGGGTSVAITGTGFTGATAVKFGVNAAASYTVNSSTRITAVTPAGGGTVNITVTAGGYSNETAYADQYSYTSAVAGGSYAILPTTAVGSSSSTQNVSITLQSATAISSITVPPTQNGVQEFTVGTVTGCSVGGTVNAANTVCTVPVTFKPQYPGVRTAALQINNDGEVVGTAGVAGVGQGPEVAVTPGAITMAVGGGVSGVTNVPQSVTTAALSVQKNGANGAALAMDGAGNLYIADLTNCLAYKVDAITNQIVAIAGDYLFTGTEVVPSTTPEPALGANVCPQAIAVDGVGNVYIVDANVMNSGGYPYEVDEVSAATGEIFVMAGGGSNPPSTTPQAALSVLLNGINSLATDGSGNLYISDFFNNLVEKVTPAGQLAIFAGGGSTPVSTTPQAATSAALNGPTGMVMDDAGNFYISDQNISVIEKVNSSGQIVSVAGGGGNAPSTTPQAALSVALNNPAGLAVDGAGDLYIADYSNQVVEQMNQAGQLVVVAGGGGTVPSATPGASTSAELGLIEGVEVDGAGNLYIADGQDIGGGDNMVERVSATSAPVNFPFTNMGSSSVPQSVKVTNIGNQSVTFTSVSAATDYPLQTGGTCTMTGSGGQSLASSASCSLSYAFHPTVGGVLDEAATLNDNNLNAANSHQPIAFAGTAVGGTNPQLSAISPPSGNSGTSVTVTGTNLSGATEMTFGSTPVTPSSSTSTSVTATAPSGSGTVNVTVTTANGTSNGESFTYNNTPSATPTFSPAAGTYTSAQTVTIGDGTSGATIYYTTNGTTPTTSSSVYSGPITVSASETVEAIATASGYTTSAVGSAAYTINLTAATPTFSPAAGTYTSAQTVTIGDGTSGATIYYTTNGTTPTTSSSVYSSPITVSVSETVEAIAIASGYTTSAVGSAAYTITGLPVAAMPTFSPAAGTYSSAQTVTISDATPSSTIYYTTNGTTPTTGSTIYSSPITVSTSETVEAIATASGYATSAVGSAAYTINTGGSATPVIALTPGIISSPAGVQGGATNPTSGQIASGNSIGAPVGIAIAPIINGAGGDIYFDNCSTAYNCSYNYQLYVIYEGGAAARAILAADGITSPTVGATYPVASPNETGPASLAGIVVDSYGNVLIADWSYGRVYMYYAGDIGGQGTNPADAFLTADPSAGVTAYYGLHAGYSYHVADGGSVVGSAPTTIYPRDVYVDSAENVFFTDGNNDVEVVYNTSGTSAATVLGAEGYTSLKQGYTYIIAGGQSVTTYPNDNDGGSSVAYNGATSTANTAINAPWGIYGDSAGNIYFADSSSNKIKKLSASTAVLTTIGGPAAGTATTVGFAGDGGLATAAEMNTPYGLVVDNGGSIYFTDTANGSVRKIDRNGYISTVSGTNGSSGTYAGDGGNATAATLGTLEMLTIDANGNLYIADRGNDLVHKVTTNAAAAGTVIATTVNNNGKFTYEGSFSFGNQAVNSPSSPATALISNITGSSVTLSGISIPSGYTQAFLGNSDVPDCTTTTVIAPGTSCTLALEFSPAASGANNGSATVTANGQSVTIAVTGAGTATGTAATPTFSPTAGTYSSSQTVTIGDSTSGATIYYTTNGSTPTTSSMVYTGPIAVPSSETVKAVATAPSYTISGVGSAAYTISDTAATPTFSPAAGTYTSAQTVTIGDGTSGATIYYTTNGTTPTTSSSVYSSPISVSASETVEAIATASGYSTSAVGAAAYTINLAIAATPTFSPEAGTYTSAQTVTISDTTPGATIYYTTNGTTPTTSSTVYSAPITVSTSETVEAIAGSVQLATNGDFATTPPMTPGSGIYTYDPTTVSGWTFTGPTQNAGSGSYGSGVAEYGSAWGFTAAPDGANQVAFLQNTSIVTQTISGLTTGQQYTVSFYLEARPSYTSNPITVSMGGTNLLSTTPGSGWTLYTETFTATATSELLSFSTNATSGDNDTGLSEVTLTEAGNPSSAVGSAAYTISAGLPSGWTDLDIGSPADAGSATYNGTTYTVSGGGADIWGTSDQFNYAETAANDDVTITSRVVTQQNSNAWAKSGVMIRDTTAANSAYVFVYVTPGEGAGLQYRASTGASAQYPFGGGSQVAPYWVRLVRSGSTFTGSISSDGTTWTTLGSVTATIGTNALSGLAVSAHDNTQLNTSTFDNVTIVP